MRTVHRVLCRLSLAAFVASGVLGCDSDGGGGAKLDDGLGEDDAPPPSICDEYPQADDAFSVGSVVRNYAMLDREDDAVDLCELAEGSAELIFLAITAES